MGLIVGMTRMVLDFSHPAPRCGSGDEDDRLSIITEVHYLHFAIILAGLCLTVYVVVSLMTKPREERQVGSCVECNPSIILTVENIWCKLG